MNILGDRLAKVFLKTGEEIWILLHIEVQGYHDKDFSERMFQYFYRVYDKYQKKIISIAIFTDENRNYKPKEFKYDYYGTKLNYEYNVYKILEQDEEELKNSNNIFSKVILTGLYLLKSKDSKLELMYKYKKELMRFLLKLAYNKEKIKDLLSFLDGILFLDNKEKELEIIDELSKTGVEREMGLSIENAPNYYLWEERGINMGLTIGEARGEARGVTIGEIKGELKKAIKSAKKMIEMGMEISIISQITELTEVEIKELMKKG